ncbi:hypothetical protein E2C01_006128 [Portunus trituberculatus]|uniref:Uncharacterized protein n=1 Tax=Portunus trituberculatus TaxID=210409 RepID=A0A5B7CW93_PORTR|nr:hypothetical protein [Portunus trituberculatus]
MGVQRPSGEAVTPPENSLEKSTTVGRTSWELQEVQKEPLRRTGQLGVLHANFREKTETASVSTPRRAARRLSDRTEIPIKERRNFICSKTNINIY